MQVDEVAVAGRLPNPRCFHTFTAIGNRCYVVGGKRINEGPMRGRNVLAVLDTWSGCWLEPLVSGPMPEVLSSHQ
ncbi:uncharacterized protein HaLaN_10409, partial [Haematococcus lacustris]